MREVGVGGPLILLVVWALVFVVIKRLAQRKRPAVAPTAGITALLIVISAVVTLAAWAIFVRVVVDPWYEQYQNEHPELRLP